MTHTCTPKPDNTCELAIDFADEGVTLTATTSVIGDHDKAMAYLPVFEADIRRIHSHLFPQPEPTEPETEEEA